MAGSNDAAWPHEALSVGETAERSRTVERADIEGFTELSGDRNPLHYDEDPSSAK